MLYPKDTREKEKEKGCGGDRINLIIEDNLVKPKK